MEIIIIIIIYMKSILKKIFAIFLFMNLNDIEILSFDNKDKLYFIFYLYKFIEILLGFILNVI